MDQLVQFAIIAIVMIAVYLIAMEIPFLEPFKRVIQIVFGAVVVIFLLKLLVGFI